MARERTGMIFTASVSFSFAYAFIGLWSLIEEIMAFIGFILGSTRLAGKVFFFSVSKNEVRLFDFFPYNSFWNKNCKAIRNDDCVP